MNQAVPMPPTVMQMTKDVSEISYAVMEKVLGYGDLSALTPKERVMLYKNVCESLGLNPLTKPFEFIKFDGKMAFYATRACAEQLRNLYTISVTKIEREFSKDGLFIYTAFLRKGNGQEDVGTGAVNIKGLSGKALANAIKIAETQAKRRGTLSICGLGWADESEVPDIPNAVPMQMNIETGEVIRAEDVEIEEHLDKLLTATSLDDLRDAYLNAYTKYKDNPASLALIVNMKDERKRALETLCEAV